MNISTIQKQAQSLGLKDTTKYTKRDLIKAIQRKEGNFDCFGTSLGNCDQMSCSWRSDCVK